MIKTLKTLFLKFPKNRPKDEFLPIVLLSWVSIYKQNEAKNRFFYFFLDFSPIHMFLGLKLPKNTFKAPYNTLGPLLRPLEGILV